jgi:hypothetical protein
LRYLDHKQHNRKQKKKNVHIEGTFCTTLLLLFCSEVVNHSNPPGIYSLHPTQEKGEGEWGPLGYLVLVWTGAMSSCQEECISAGDTGWVMASTGLVMLMTPGLALFYGGLVQEKNLLCDNTICDVWIFPLFCMAFRLFWRI